ncbi:MAG: hypothetical protein PW844_20580 [Pantoea sp.]|uniref:hypothetical protein n=1 Tax=unclassified Pantoea TaxID=2630326 RepID=UPI00238ACB52|nr:hypothetical protein [Pantoea sp.]MDE1188829.1 hypothetical protein [Pantoea sp.]
MSHNTREQSAPEKVKRHAATVRMDDSDKSGLRTMTEEHPLYTESVIIRAALQAFLVYDGAVRTAIVLASLNDKDVGDVMRRHGMGGLMKPGGTYAD